MNTETGAREPRFSYGWVIVAASFVLLIGSFGTQLCFTVLLKPLSEHFDCSRAAISGAMSLLMGVSGLMGIIMGRMTDRFNTRAVVAIGMIVGTASYSLLSVVESLWQFYLCFGVGAGIYAGSTYAPISATLSKWFGAKRTLALGIALMGITVGQMILAPVISWVVDTNGWRTAFVVLAVIAFVCALPALVLMRKAPEGAAAAAVHGAGEGSTQGMTLREAARTAPFWMLMATGFMISFGFYMFASHLVPYATDVGLSTTQAALVMTVSSIGGIVGTLLAWTLTVKLGQRHAFALAVVGEALAMFLFLVTRDAWAFYVVGALMGFAFSAASPVRIGMASPLFGLRSIGTILGFATLAFSIGGIVGPFLAGYIYDTRDGYDLAFIVAGVILVVGVALVYLFGSHRKR